MTIKKSKFLRKSIALAVVAFLLLLAFISGRLILVDGVGGNLSAKTMSCKTLDSLTGFGKWGKIANTTHLNQSYRASIFFPGEPRAGTVSQYTVNPLADQSYIWGNDTLEYYFSKVVVPSGINVIKISQFSVDGSLYGEAVTTPESVNQTIVYAKKHNVLFMPFFEASAEHNRFYSDFPRNLKILKNDMVYWVNTYGKNKSWLKMYDKTGKPRLAIGLIETIHFADDSVSSKEFALGFERLAQQIYNETGVWVGFVIDPSRLPVDEMSPQQNRVAVSYIARVRSILAVDFFGAEAVPYGYKVLDHIDTASRVVDQTIADELVKGAEKNLGLWYRKVPLIIPVIDYYDDSKLIVRPDRRVYGGTKSWNVSQFGLIRQYPCTLGVSYPTINGNTEGYSLEPSRERGKSAITFFLRAQEEWNLRTGNVK